MPFVATTRLRLRSWRFVPGLLWYALRSRRQARSAPGNLDALTLSEANRTFWTCTVWRDEADMRAFMTSGAHREAMRRLTEDTLARCSAILEGRPVLIKSRDPRLRAQEHGVVFGS